MTRYMMPLLLLCSLGRAQAGYIDSVNPNAVPIYDTAYGNSFNNVGWYYTPAQNYTLTGIFTFFAQDEFGGGTRTVTVQIQSDRPAAGGTVLDQGMFSENGFQGYGAGGATFATPVTLLAGTTYFVDFLNVTGLNVNLGQWASVNGQHVATQGATTRLSAWYFGAGTDTSFTFSQVGNAADGTAEFGPVSGIEPILFFSGTPLAVPEPSSILMLGLGVIGVALKFRRVSARGKEFVPRLPGARADASQ